MDILERLKWGDPALYRSLLFFIALATLALGYLYWETTGRAQDAEAELATATQERDEANARIGELDEKLATVTQELDDANIRIGELEEELATTKGNLATVTTERDTLLAENETLKKDRIIVYGDSTLLEHVQPNMIQGTTPSDEIDLLLLLLRGDLIVRNPGVDVYRSNGTIALPPGNWAFAEKGIGGERATGAGNSELHWEAVPDACVEQPAGSWHDAIQATCEVNIEWTVNSRYPYSLFLILPIDEFIPQEGE